MSSSLGVGGGSSSGSTGTTRIGDNTGRGPGGLDEAAQIYGDQFQRQQALSDLLTGGPQYGASPYLYGQGGTQHYWPLGNQQWNTGVSPGTGGGGGGPHPNPRPNPPPTPGPGYGMAPGPESAGGVPTANGEAGTPTTGNGPLGNGQDYQDPGQHDPFEPGWSNPGTPAGANENQWYAGNNPIFGSLKGEPTPNGGLVGQYGNWMSNPWGAAGTGPSGEKESDVLGSYNWMSSGQRTGDEQAAFDMAKNLGTPSYKDDSIWNAIAGQGGYTPGVPGDTKNEHETQTWDSTRGLTTDAAPSDYQRADFYKQMMDQGGMSPEAKAALQHQTYTAAAQPFQQGQEALARMGKAHGNPNAGFGSQIQMANQASNAIENAANQNVMQQYGEERRQKEAGAQGLGQVQQQFDTRRIQGLQLQQAQNQAQREREQNAITNAQKAAAQDRANQEAAVSGMAGQNAALRGYQQVGAAGKENLFNTMFGRTQAGAAGQQGLADRATQQASGNMASLANILGQTGATNFHGINESGGI